MSQAKKEIRRKFRDDCLNRDNDTCKMCGLKSPSREESLKIFDVHHIVDRSEMPNGGYVKDNGISLCQDCHIKAEVFHSTGIAHPGYAPEDLYKKINSTLEKAIIASEKLS